MQTQNLLTFGIGNSKLAGDTLTFSLPAGHTCPGALHCLSKAMVKADGTKYLLDGTKAEFRCFAASAEVLFPSVYNSRQANFALLKKCKSSAEMAQLIIRSIEAELTPRISKIRIHVSGDYFSLAYLKAWIEAARHFPDLTFYGYTKSIKFLVACRNNIPGNLCLVASYGGKYDHLISEHSLKYARVIMHPNQSNGMAIDHDDSNAWDKSKPSFCLLIHGQQKAGSDAAEALKLLKAEGIKFSYPGK